MKFPKYEKAVKALAKRNKEQYNLLKVAEECNEVSKAIIDLINKPGKGTKELVGQELGDLILRINILLSSDEKLEGTAQGRAFQKVKRYLKRLKMRKYEKLNI